MARGTSLALLLWQTKHSSSHMCNLPEERAPGTLVVRCAPETTAKFISGSQTSGTGSPLWAIVTLRWEEEERDGDETMLP